MHGSLELLLRSFLFRLVYHASLVDSVRDFPFQDTDSDLDVYLRAVFVVVCDRTAGFRSGDVQRGRDAQRDAWSACFVDTHASQKSSGRFNF